jgi:cation/acetate symporter
MIYEPSVTAVILFFVFVFFVLGLSFYFAGKTKSSSGFFAAGGTIHWAVNGIAFAGDYLSAASFLGICGLISTFGYDGFMYSIGFLAGWVVALFVVAEPLKRLGKYTFADALDSKFNSKGIQFSAAISTLVVSICYLIPQMVGAGDLITPLLGLPHNAGVLIVGGIVIFIVSTAGMTSTTYVQFLKGGLLIIFSTLMVGLVLFKGFNTEPRENMRFPQSMQAEFEDGILELPAGYVFMGEQKIDNFHFLELSKEGISSWWKVDAGEDDEKTLHECLSLVKTEKEELYNGLPKTDKAFYPVGRMSRIILDGKEVEKTGPLGPFSFLSTLADSDVVRHNHKSFVLNDGRRVFLWYPQVTKGENLMRPGLFFKIHNDKDIFGKLNFISLMLALIFGTAALPHILIRYYTVPSQKCARKSTIVAIAAIGFFYILTLYMGLGALVNGVLDVESSNMAAPLLAKEFGVFFFSIISALAFATVLGTVSGLIVAASGAVAHDLVDRFMGVNMTDKTKVWAGKISAVAVGIVAILFGIYFKGMNVSFLVGLAFAVAASANFPAIIMLLFWKKTNAKGITASIIVGTISSLGFIMMSPSMFKQYGLGAENAWFPIDNPALFSMPISFIVLIAVSILTNGTQKQSKE